MPGGVQNPNRRPIRNWRRILDWRQNPIWLNCCLVGLTFALIIAVVVGIDRFVVYIRSTDQVPSTVSNNSGSFVHVATLHYPHRNKPLEQHGNKTIDTSATGQTVHTSATDQTVHTSATDQTVHTSATGQTIHTSATGPTVDTLATGVDVSGSDLSAKETLAIIEEIEDAGEIMLEDRNIRYLFSNSFEKKTKLRVLILRANPLVIPSNKVWIQHPSLMHLDISDCNLPALDPIVFMGMKSLKLVYMQNNPGCLETRERAAGFPFEIMC